MFFSVSCHDQFSNVHRKLYGFSCLLDANFEPLGFVLLSVTCKALIPQVVNVFTEIYASLDSLITYSLSFLSEYSPLIQFFSTLSLKLWSPF